MAFMEFSGAPCLHPGQLLTEFRAKGFSTSAWYGKANSFTVLRGADPSYGYLLVPFSAYSNPQSGLRVVFDELDQDNTNPQLRNKPVSISFPDLAIEDAKQITPGIRDEQSLYLIKVVDSRHVLSKTYVGKRYNLVLSYTPPDSNHPHTGKFTYVPETVRATTNPGNPLDTIYTPYTWKELFQEVFTGVVKGKPITAALDFGDVTFPLYTPQDLDWRYVTGRDALEMLLEWTNTSIIPRSDGTFKLVEIKDENDAGKQGHQLPELLAQYPTVLSTNPLRTKEPGYEPPEHLVLHFRRLAPSNPQVTEYRTITKDPSNANKTRQSLPLRIPAYDVGDNSGLPLVQNPDNISNGFLNLQQRYFAQFPSQENSVGGFHPVLPTGYLESVSWFDLGSGARTWLCSITRRVWIIQPHILIHDTDKTNIAIGRAVPTVSENTPNFLADNLRLIAGSLPDGIFESQPFPNAVLVINTFRQAYSAGDKVIIFSRPGAIAWDTDEKGGTGSSSIIKAELFEDKSLSSFAALAVLMDDAGNTLDPANPDNIIYLTDPQQEFTGFSPYTDGAFGPQRGYIAVAYKTTDHYLSDVNPPGYDIITLEGQARWIEGTLVLPWSNQLTGEMVVTSYWGAYPNNRPPKTTPKDYGSGGTGQPQDIRNIVYIYDPLNLHSTFAAGSKVRAILDERSNIYVLAVAPAGGGSDHIHGRLWTDLTIAMPTVEMVVELATGQSPAGQNGRLLVHNKPDLLNPTANRFIFVGNRDGYCMATRFSDGSWQLDLVQTPIIVPVAL